MKKSMKAIAKSMRVLEECQIRTLENQNESIWIQKQNLGIDNDVLAHSRDANRIMMKRFEEVVDEAKRMIGLMKVKQ